MIRAPLRALAAVALASLLAACPPPFHGLMWTKEIPGVLDGGCVTAAVEAVEGVSNVRAGSQTTVSHTFPTWRRVETVGQWIQYEAGVAPALGVSFWADLPHGPTTVRNAAYTYGVEPSQSDMDEVVSIMRRVAESISRMCGVDLTRDVQVACRGVRCDTPSGLAVN